MASSGFNFSEPDARLTELSIELSSHKEWLDRIETQGNRPEEWVEFIEHCKSRLGDVHESFWNRWISDLYVKALKSVPGDMRKTVMFVKLWIDYANLKSEDNADDGHMLFGQARAMARKFSIAHIAAAEFELKQGNKTKCQKILKKAEILNAEPASLLKKALQNLKDDKSYLLTASDKANYFAKKNENMEETPPLTSSVSLADRSTKNKFLVDMVVSRASVISNVKNEPHSSSEKVFQPIDPFGSSEKWTSGSLLSEKWGSCGNFPFPAPDRRQSGIQNVDRRPFSMQNVDRRLSSINPATERRFSNIHSVTASHGPSSSLLSHHTTPGCHEPHKNASDSNSNSSGDRNSSSNISRLFNATSLPRRVKVSSQRIHKLEEDEDNSTNEDNTISKFKPAIFSSKVGLSFPRKYYVNQITEEDGDSKSSVQDQESLKADKFDCKSSVMSQISDDNNVNMNPIFNGKDDDDDFPPLPTPPKLSYMRNRGENPHPLSTSSSFLSTSPLSTATSSSAVEKPKSPTAFNGLLKSRTTSETDSLLAVTSANPHVLAESKPVAEFLKPPQLKCHPDTPRPVTDTLPLSANKENVVAPPPPSRHCLDNSLKTSSFSSSSSISKRPYLSDINPLDMGHKLDSALSKPDSLLPNYDKENQPSSHVTPAKFKEGEHSSQKNVQTCVNEFVVPQSLMDNGKPSTNSKDVSSKAPAPSPVAENGSGSSDEVQLKEQKPKPELQSQESQQNRVENPVSSSQGQVTYTMSLNQPIQAKKHRYLNVNGKAYMILKMVGRGGSSKVYQVMDQSYNMMAVKHIDFEGATEATIQSYVNEVTLLKRLQYSDLVIKLHDYELDRAENCLYLVLECGETDLATMFKNRTKKEKVPRVMVKFYWVEMLRAVQVLHKEGIVHSDLKPANFLIVGGNLKLIDFGIAGVIQNDRTSMTRDSQMGTLNYMSPETILEMQSDTGNRLHKFKISVKSDVWSLGCILYSMIYGKTPFQHITNPPMKLQAIINPNYHIEFGEEYNTDLVDTMKKCLCRNPKERLTICELLQHPYLAETTKAAPSEANATEGTSRGEVSNLVDMRCMLENIVDVASPNTISILKKTLLQACKKINK